MREGSIFHSNLLYSNHLQDGEGVKAIKVILCLWCEG